MDVGDGPAVDVPQLRRFDASNRSSRRESIGYLPHLALAPWMQAGCDDAEEVSEEVYLDVNSYTYAIPDDSSARYFRVYAYPQDKDVAYHYPSSPTRAVGEASSI